ncbi:hypothetical protein [Finegoldia magna]|uniref:hypothetical protein n=1 Tax=Finegoldia magna TaxID=1260 RepID=UPI0028047F08|nr:hypothetical protein [Finegoldia magna]MDU5070613.1 hypothetical protein [Finegoldia magna]
MKKFLMIALCMMIFVSCGKKEVYKGVESSVKVDRIKKMDSHNKYTDKLKNSEFIQKLYGDKIVVLKDGKNFIYDDSKDELVQLDDGYGIHDVDNKDYLLYKSDESFASKLMIKGDDGMNNLTSTEHISDAKLSDKNVYVMVLRSDSPIKFFECEIFRNNNDAFESTGKIGKLIKNDKSVMYMHYEKDKLTVKDMDNKEIFSRDLTEDEFPIDVVMNNKDVFYSLYDFKTGNSRLYKNDKLIMESTIKGYENVLKRFKVSKKYMTWLDNKISYNLEKDKLVFFEDAKDDTMIVPIGDSVYSLKIKNSIGVFNDETIKFK